MNIKSLKHKLDKLPVPESEREPPFVTLINGNRVDYWPAGFYFHNPPTPDEQTFLDSLKREPLKIILQSWGEPCD